MVHNPTVNCGLASSPFARRYLGNRCFFLFLRVLRCFSSPGSLPTSNDRITEHYLCWVAPFGYLRINACLRLPVAFRSLLRPSSALGAKASTVCPYYLDFVLHSPSAELMQPTLSFSMLPLLCSCQGTSERKKISVGGDKEDRTPDLLLARQALSQLSYAPT